MIRRFLSATILSLSFAIPAANAARQKSIAPEKAPAEWIAYAGTVNDLITAWLGAEDEAAVRLRTYLDTTRPAPDQPTPAITLRLWINRIGMIERVEFAPLADAQADTDLHTLLTGRTIGTLPPKGMLLPLRLAIALAPPPAPESAAPPPGQ